MIELRDLLPEDEERLFLWRSEPEVARWMSDAEVSDREAHRAWFDQLASDPDMRGWMIQRGGRPSGLLTLTGLTGHHRRAGWNWFVGDSDARGRGVGRAAQVLGLDRAFGDLKLHKVWAEVMADNDAALKVMTGAGFQREGYLRGHVLKDAAPRDVVMLGILSEEWAELAPTARRGLSQAGLIAA
ncbi:UDP-4-amino-4,6-dideoxy-N-acetyl-beta-L-altrosamine N-acetyltransferase [Caulobacter mirabilis]|uniref:UDP-4-amino-4, 6-dideoxy-N-acetyl-beta-L-altrosamine N-acetyltransferase n=1 Tax=Caulobacter mirabilis TaxID=69666 RepID=A0A2D2AZL1_9CAUL|nr:UDP-4-amino-4,6-dideoxy-N-acetyl-beta-L-altrosamine N-acetyltransferase [Caulobacter mirabilis]ATQ43449.1 UDP-4-amino-4,6-dideoxy-N-acetyl-beta-L-altrosamine N-acetyltransferase [Caulobacter mirabilis]